MLDTSSNAVVTLQYITLEMRHFSLQLFFNMLHDFCGQTHINIQNMYLSHQTKLTNLT